MDADSLQAFVADVMGAWGIDPAGLRGKLIAQFWARKLAAVRERDVREAFDRAERQFTKRAPTWPEFADLLRSVTGEQRQQAREARNELGPVTPAERREIAGQLSAEAVRRLQRNRTDRYGLWLRQLAETYEQNAELSAKGFPVQPLPKLREILNVAFNAAPDPATEAIRREHLSGQADTLLQRQLEQNERTQRAAVEAQQLELRERTERAHG